MNENNNYLARVYLCLINPNNNEFQKKNNNNYTHTHTLKRTHELHSNNNMDLCVFCGWICLFIYLKIVEFKIANSTDLQNRPVETEMNR